MAASFPSPDREGEQVQVREADRRDLDAYLRLALENAGALERKVGLLDRSEQGFGMLRRPLVWTFLVLLRRFDRSPLRFLVADDRGSVVGSTITILAGPWAYVAAVGVREDHRRRGIAARLVARAEQLGRHSGKATMVLEVDAENEPARRLYAKLGWRAGLRARWWELPARPVADGAPVGRRARRRESRSAHAAAAAQLGYEFPKAYVHPCELACRALGGRPETLAAGPGGNPSLVVRVCAGDAGRSGFLLPVAISADADPGEATVLEAARAALARAGNGAVFVPVLGESPRVDELLRRAGGAPRAASELWSKEISHPRRVRGPIPWTVAADAPRARGELEPG